MKYKHSHINQKRNVLTHNYMFNSLMPKENTRRASNLIFNFNKKSSESTNLLHHTKFEERETICSSFRQSTPSPQLYQFILLSCLAYPEIIKFIDPFSPRLIKGKVFSRKKIMFPRVKRSIRKLYMIVPNVTFNLSWKYNGNLFTHYFIRMLINKYTKSCIA